MKIGKTDQQMAEGVFVTRTAGIGCEGIEDQYADGRAAKLWEVVVSGDSPHVRTRHYKEFLVKILREKGCRRILDVACGTGVDSVMLLEEGFEVMSIDASDKMLKHALKKRWLRRKEKAFDKWVIEEANWLTLPEDLEDYLDGGFDAVICLGNSFAHLVDITGDQSKQRLALSNFEQCIKPSGLLVIDHRNFDAMLDRKSAPAESIYYSNLADLTTSVLYTSGRPVVITLDYRVSVDNLMESGESKKARNRIEAMTGSADFRLSYYPHRLNDFTEMLRDAFPDSEHTVLADFQPSESIENPGFYIHVMEKPEK